MSDRERMRVQDVHLLPGRRRRPLAAGTRRHVAPCGGGRHAAAAGRCATTVHEEAGRVVQSSALADFDLASLGYHQGMPGRKKGAAAGASGGKDSGFEKVAGVENLYFRRSRGVYVTRVSLKSTGTWKRLETDVLTIAKLRHRKERDQTQKARQSGPRVTGGERWVNWQPIRETDLRQRRWLRHQSLDTWVT